MNNKKNIELIIELKKFLGCDNKTAIKKASTYTNLIKYYLKQEKNTSN